jgi:hypothetical protein
MRRPQFYRSPGRAVSERAALELSLTSASLREMRRFLAGVEKDAANALSSPVIMASAVDFEDELDVAEPFTRGLVQRRWKTMSERLLAEFSSWLPPTYLSQVDARLGHYPLADEAYSSVKSVLSAAVQELWARERIVQQLSKVLDPNMGTYWPRPDDPVGINWADQIRRIARTEATSAYGYASVQRAAKDPATRWKRWVAVGDKHTRKTHAAANGQTVSVAEPFMVGAAALQYPGDPSGGSGETTNCRCAVVGVA